MDEFNILHRELATAVVAFQEAAARRVGMTAAERKCAGILAGLGQATPKQLADRTGLTTGAITGIVDRLERSGYARRTANPQDRRSIIVSIHNGDRLAKMTAPLFQSLTDAMSDLNERYSPEERALVLRHLVDTTTILRGEIEKLQADERHKG